MGCNLLGQRPILITTGAVIDFSSFAAWIIQINAGGCVHYPKVA
jgi:hypothetical protein